MLIQNLLVKFEKEQDGKFIFLTENNIELAIAKDILPANLDRQQSLYLSMDTAPLLSSLESKKQLLNELLNPDDK